MSDLIDEFAAFYHDYNDITPQRRKMQLRTLRLFEASIAPTPVAQASADDLRNHLAALVAQGLHVNTVRQRLNAIRPFFTWLWEKKAIDGDRLMELRAVKPPRGASGEGKPRPYTRKEIQRFWRELDRDYPIVRLGRKHRPTEELQQRLEIYLPRWWGGSLRWVRVMPYAKRLQLLAIVALALDGGLRRDEVFNLTLEDMHPDNEYVVVRGARKNRYGEVRVRAVPWMSPHMREAVQNWLEFRARLNPPHDRPWLSLHFEHRLKPMRHRQFEMLLCNIGRGWEFHRMRHTAATEMLRSGIKLEIVMRIMGHARLEQTLQYAKLLNEDIVRAARRVEITYADAMRPAA